MARASNDETPFKKQLGQRSTAQARITVWYKKAFKSKLSGNAIHCTNALLSLMKVVLCGKLHCQKFLD